jgi:hypothetical protein
MIDLVRRLNVAGLQMKCRGQVNHYTNSRQFKYLLILSRVASHNPFFIEMRVFDRFVQRLPR